MDLVTWIFSFGQIFSDESKDIRSNEHSHVIIILWRVMTGVARHPLSSARASLGSP